MSKPQHGKRTSLLRQRRDGRSRRWWLVTMLSVFALGGGAAFAYFLSNSTGNSHVSVGIAANNHLTITDDGWMDAGGGTSTPLMPTTTQTNSDTAIVQWTVKNNTAADVNIISASAAMEGGTPNTSVMDNNGTTDVGCMVSWFTWGGLVGTSATIGTTWPGGEAAFPLTVAAGATVTLSEMVYLTDNGTNQDPCESANPEAVLTLQTT